MNTTTWWRERRPWCCEGGESPPAVLLAAKLLVLYRLEGVAKSGFDAPFLPFWEPLAHPWVAMVWPWLLGAMFWAGAASVLFNLMPRAGMGAAGGALVLAIIGARPAFSNSLLLFGVLLLCLALTGRGDRWRWWVRGQLALVYGGAALNKLLAADWLNGRFFAHWAGEVLGLEWYARWDEAWNGSLSLIMGWTVIVAEFGLAGLAVRPRKTIWLVVAVLGFHSGMLVFTGGEISWVFMVLMGIAVFALMDEPAAIHAGGRQLWRPWWPFVMVGLVLGLKILRWWLSAELA